MRPARPTSATASGRRSAQPDQQQREQASGSVKKSVRVASVIFVHPSLPVRNVRELIAVARACPGEVKYASAGGAALHAAAPTLE
jgi:tripartite-type tricarboxylate transporter receptor subunit TctC